MDKKYHYVYITTDGIRYYIGVRSSNCLPSQDKKYWGSHSDKNYKPFKKFIIKVFYNRDLAQDYERYLQIYNDVIKNKNFVNRSISTSNGFSTAGSKREVSEETRKKLSKSGKGRIPWNKGKKCPQISESCKGKEPWNKGKTTSEETKKRISKSRQGIEPWNKGKKTGSNKKLSESKKGKRYPAMFDQTIYYFIHLTGVEEYCTRQELKDKYNLKKHLDQICNGSRRSYKGWICLCLLTQ